MEHLEYECEVETGMRKPSAVEEDDALHAAKYMSIEGAQGLTEGEEKNMKMAKNAGVANTKSKVLRRATRRDGLDDREV